MEVFPGTTPAETKQRMTDDAAWPAGVRTEL
jgi:hypothetical protein